jgi:hypothetical protein
MIDVETNIDMSYCIVASCSYCIALHRRFLFILHRIDVLDDPARPRFMAVPLSICSAICSDVRSTHMS